MYMRFNQDLSFLNGRRVGAESPKPVFLISVACLNTVLSFTCSQYDWW